MSGSIVIEPWQAGAELRFLDNVWSRGLSRIIWVRRESKGSKTGALLWFVSQGGVARVGIVGRKKSVNESSAVAAHEQRAGGWEKSRRGALGRGKNTGGVGTGYSPAVLPFASVSINADSPPHWDLRRATVGQRQRLKVGALLDRHLSNRQTTSTMHSLQAASRHECTQAHADAAKTACPRRTASQSAQPPVPAHLYRGL